MSKDVDFLFIYYRKETYLSNKRKGNSYGKKHIDIHER